MRWRRSEGVDDLLDLDALRRTTPGHLVLGNGFDTRDLAAHAVGVLVAVMLERLMRRII